MILPNGLLGGEQGLCGDDTMDDSWLDNELNDEVRDGDGDNIVVVMAAKSKLEQSKEWLSVRDSGGSDSLYCVAVEDDDIEPADGAALLIVW